MLAATAQLFVSLKNSHESRLKIANSQAALGRFYLLFFGAVVAIMGFWLSYEGAVGRADLASAFMGFILAMCGLRAFWLGRRVKNSAQASS